MAGYGLAAGSSRSQEFMSRVEPIPAQSNLDFVSVLVYSCPVEAVVPCDALALCRVKSQIECQDCLDVPKVDWRHEDSFVIGRYAARRFGDRNFG